MRLKGRIAVVTGGAGGMGRGAALKLAQEGAAIEILDRQDAAQACEAIRQAGGAASAMACDTTQFNRFFHAMLRRGVYFAPSAFEAGFLSSAHGEAEVAMTIAAAREAFTEVAA